MKLSQLATKTRKATGAEDPSINAQLLERGGYISKLMSGVYTYLPLGLRVLNNIENIIREEMDALGGQELLMPALQPKEPWLTTGRWDKVDVLFKLQGAGDRDLALGPTHEEIVTPLIGQFIQSYRDLPRAVYQIQTKFRNEARAKSGLLRGREFRMKDLYSFHADSADLDQFYDRAIEAYFNIFNRCGLGHKTFLTFAPGGIFSKYSHEFQTLTPHGEDTIFLCTTCNIAINHEIINDVSGCVKCGNKQLAEHKSIEVGNIFKLMARFSEPFKVNFTDAHSAPHEVLMGCYGIGTSRLMGAIVEVLHDEKGIAWPDNVAPYQVQLVSLLKDNTEPADQLYKYLQEQGLSVLYDDRTDISAGQKFADADLLGMPWRLVISAKTMAQNQVELKARTGSQADLMASQQAITLIKDKMAQKVL